MIRQILTPFLSQATLHPFIFVPLVTWGGRDWKESPQHCIVYVPCVAVEFYPRFLNEMTVSRYLTLHIGVTHVLEELEFDR